MSNTPISYPIRINRYLFLQKICSRREADRMIEKQQVLVNGRPAVLGQQVSEKDTITFTKKALKQREKKMYIAFNKPTNVVSHNPQNGEQSVDDFVRDIPAKLAPLGRLDKASHGLMILSNDGTIVDKLLNPKYQHEKEYTVSVNKRITKEFLEKMESGVNIEGYKTKRAQISKINPNSFHLTLTEGKKHQIRRMCAALGYQVQTLRRDRVQNIRLGNIKSGKFREIQGKELLDFMKSINH